MKDFQLTKHNVDRLTDELYKELDENPVLIVSSQSAGTGKWGMARLWRAWMDTTAKFMAANGSKMPLMITKDGKWYGSRPFDENDAHELFTHQWLGADAEGFRLSWSKKGRDGMRPATKGERFNALRKHEQWCLEKGVRLFKPRDSEYSQIEWQQENGSDE